MMSISQLFKLLAANQSIMSLQEAKYVCTDWSCARCPLGIILSSSWLLLGSVFSQVAKYVRNKAAEELRQKQAVRQAELKRGQELAHSQSK